MIEGSNENQDNSFIKENPFEVVDQKVQKNIINMACSPMISFVSNSKVNTFTEVPNQTEHPESPKMVDNKLKNIKLLEEFIVVGISEEIKRNLQNFPTNTNVEFRPKLTYSYPESEKS